MALGITAITVGTAAFLVGLGGLRTGRSVPVWTAELAVAGAVIAIGGLLVQQEPDTASWILGPVAGAVMSVVHGRTVFAPGGPFRT